MSRFNPADSGYVEVKDRVVAFYAANPQGSLQSEVVLFNENVVVMKAFAFRSPDDPRPGVGHSQMQIPGPTSFTKGSEIENAETSAIGRAIAALGFEVHRSYASANEISNKDETSDTSSSAKAQQAASSGSSNVAATPPLENETAGKDARDGLISLADNLKVSKAELSELRQKVTDKARSSQFTVSDIAAMKDAITKLGLERATGGQVVS